jgi:hypothetical protein
MLRKSKLAVGIAVVALAAAGAVAAQEAIPTAANSPTGGAPTPISSAGPLRLSDHRDYGGDDIVRSVGPCGAPPKPDGTPDKSPHGEVYAGVGTHGYREGGGVVCVPIGDKAAVTVAVDAGRIGDRGGRH